MDKMRVFCAYHLDYNRLLKVSFVFYVAVFGIVLFYQTRLSFFIAIGLVTLWSWVEVAWKRVLLKMHEPRDWMNPIIWTICFLVVCYSVLLA